MDVRVDGLDEIVRRVEDQSARAVAVPLEDSVREIVQSARQRWPTETGRSRDALRADVRTSGAEAVAEVVCDEPYGRYVRDVGEQRGTSWRRLVREPVEDLAADPPPEILAALVGVVEGT